MVTTTKQPKSRNGQNQKVLAKKKKVKREIQIVACPSAFPISERTERNGKHRKQQQPVTTNIHDEIDEDYKATGQKKKELVTSQLDWNETVKEVRAYGAKAFSGKQKREYEDEQYFQLTGRHKKKAKVPLPIVRGIRKAHAKRELKERREAREAGIVLPKASKQQTMKKTSSTIRSHGPAPNIGFMSKGIFRVQTKRK